MAVLTKVPLQPFADDATSLGCGGLTIENGRDRIAVYGTLDLTRDRAGLALVKEMLALLGAVETALEGQPDLPDAVPPPLRPGTTKNPFG